MSITRQASLPAVHEQSCSRFRKAATENDAVSVYTDNPSARHFSMSHPKPKSNVEDTELKERVREFWQAHPCGSKFSDSEIGTREFFDRVEQHRYEKEWHIPAAAD